ncbi:MAG: hypothetical protein RDV41_04955 [Planctomycetota bacterium]|nr:hypothetical protein [Planctomycetota bacterium]
MTVQRTTPGQPDHRCVFACLCVLAGLLAAASPVFAQATGYDAASASYRLRQALDDGGNVVDGVDWYDSSASYRGYHALGQPTTYSFVSSPSYNLGPGLLYRIFDGIPMQPTINFAPPAFTFNAVQGGPNPPNQNLSIWSTPNGSTLNWTVSDDAAWLTLNPLTGTSFGEVDLVALSVDITGLAPGTYNATITITGVGAANSPQTVAVQLIVAAVGGPVISYTPNNMTFQAAEGGANPPAQFLQIWNGGTGTLNWTVTDNATWLFADPSSGSSNGEIDPVAISVNIAGLPAGNYVAQITITAPGAANSPQVVNVTLQIFPAAQPLIANSPDSFTFSAMEGGANPPQQTMSVWNGGGGTLNWIVGSSQAWLTLAPIAGSSTGEHDIVVLSVNIAGLPAGTHVATISIVDLGAPNNPQDATVTLTVVGPPGGGPLLQHTPSAMTFAAPEGGPNPAAQTLFVWRQGSGTLNWAVSCSATWLSAGPAAGSSTGETDPIGVAVDVSGLAGGTYVALITITGNTANSPQYVLVTLIVAPPVTPVIACSPSSFSFSAVQGGANPPNQALSIWNATPGILNWTVTDNAAWLTLAPANGVSTGPTDPDNVAVSVNIGAMVAGTYNAIIQVAAVGAPNSPVVIPVVLTIYAPGSTIISYTPVTLNFTAALGGANPAAQTLFVWNGGAGALAWNVVDDAAWLTVGPPTAGLSNGPPATAVPVIVNITGVPAGWFIGTITINGTVPPTANTPQYAFVVLHIVDLSGPPGAGGDSGGGSGGGGCFVSSAACETGSVPVWPVRLLAAALLLVVLQISRRRVRG